jgi:hypothetical protein
MTARFFVFITACALAAAAHAQPNLMNHGDFDGLPAGTAPNCGIPAGAWHFVPGLCELSAQEFQIVPTSTFDQSATGNSLMQRVDYFDPNPQDPQQAIYLRNQSFAPISPLPGEVVVLELDLWVVEGFAGGSFWFGDTDAARGVQVSWFTDGRLTASRDPASPSPCPDVLLQPFPTGTWQSLRIVIDLNTQRYDLWWSRRGEAPVRLGHQRPFQSGVHVTQIARFVFIRFPQFSSGPCPTNGMGATRSYLDNVRVYTEPAACYPNCDGSTVQPILNVDDFTCFINDFALGQSLPPAQQVASYANCDGSTIAPVLNVDDFTCFINAFAGGCP